MGAGNQQGRPKLSSLACYIVGFVDGEGSFHVAVQRNPTVRLKWQVVPEFHISQNARSKGVLELIKKFFGCGYIKPNHRSNKKDDSWVYVVKSRDDLRNVILPFFREHSLLTEKRVDFKSFAKIVEGMTRGEHKTKRGLEKLLKKAFSMNCSGKSRKLSLKQILKDLEPSETVRRTL